MVMRMLVVLIFLTQCELSDPPDYVSNNGVQYFWKYDKFTNLPQVNDNENWYIAKLLERGFKEKDVRKSLVQAKILLYDNKPIPCWWSKSGLCNGFADINVLHVRNMGCPYNAPINHELTHWILYNLKNDSDPNHVGDIWKMADTMPRACSYEP